MTTENKKEIKIRQHSFLESQSDSRFTWPNSCQSAQNDAQLGPIFISRKKGKISIKIIRM